MSLLGYSLRKSGDLEGAQGFYLRALAADPDHLGANQYLGELLVERRLLHLAQERLEVLSRVCGPDCVGRDALAAAIAAAR